MIIGNKKSTSTEKTGLANAKQNESSRSKEKYAITKKNV